MLILKTSALQMRMDRVYFVLRSVCTTLALAEDRQHLTTSIMGGARQNKTSFTLLSLAP